MKSKFLLGGLFFFILITLLSYFLFYKGILSFIIFNSILLAAFITAINFVLGFISIKYALIKAHKFFIPIILGSMVIRIFLMLGFVLISLFFLDIRSDVFIFTLFIFYVLFLLSEIFYLIKPQADN